ncbi:MAG: SpoIIE family protein phosphatase, partial [Oscillospiraceae bacterium]|nr:SpoIIE family protein phosphatase [Oscillospiraceae bacterium]
LMIPAIASFLTAITGLCFQVFLHDRTPVPLYALRIAVTGLTAVLFTQAAHCRDPVTDWLVGGVAVLALAQIQLGPLGLGYLAVGLLAVSCAFPAAALAGLGLDLAQVTKVPMTAVACLAWFIRLIPFDKRWQHYAAPGFAAVAVMAACGIWDFSILPGLVLGGAAAALLPPRSQIPHRRGQTGVAQVRLEVGAEMLLNLRQLLTEVEPPQVDAQALLDRAVERACGSCSARNKCTQRVTLTTDHILHPLEADCRKQGRLIPELRFAQERLKTLNADRSRRLEYRAALAQQYCFLGQYLRSLADQLPRKAKQAEPEFEAQVAARSRGKERANGDRCLAFSGPECRFYVLLCDGMGTGLGAAQDGFTAAGLLRQMLIAGFPAEHALESLNSLLALRGTAGAVTADLAELRLDTGIACIYKWGAAPSWVLTRGGAQKIGTATPPPGLCAGENRMTAEKLSLRRGEVLIMLSDGVDGEGIQHLLDLSPDAPPGELAADILEKGCGNAEDDATAAVIRLRPASLPTA